MEHPKPQKDALTERIESGEYFREARDWYSILYLMPISQRVFFIVVACFACLFMFAAFISVGNLLPIAPRVPFPIYNDKMQELKPRMERFKAAEEPANPAIKRFYLTTYIQRREGYSASQMLANRAFVLRHSDEVTRDGYLQVISQGNPQSPVRRYGRSRILDVQVRQVLVQPRTAGQALETATIDFSTIVVAKESQQKTDWTATITYEYTDLVVRNTYDALKGDYVLDFDAPTFKVVGYEKRERLTQVPR